MIKDIVGAIILFGSLVLAAQFCATPKAEGQGCQTTCSCQIQTYTETLHIGTRTVLCIIFVDACGNVTRSCT